MANTRKSGSAAQAADRNSYMSSQLVAAALAALPEIDATKVEMGK